MLSVVFFCFFSDTDDRRDESTFEMFGIRIQSATIIVTGVLLCGCSDQSQSTTPAQATSIINTVCPIMGGEATAEVAVSWQGKRIGFCCPPCIEEWNELSDSEKTEKLSKAAKEAQSPQTDH